MYNHILRMQGALGARIIYIYTGCSQNWRSHGKTNENNEKTKQKQFRIKRINLTKFCRGVQNFAKPFFVCKNCWQYISRNL